MTDTRETRFTVYMHCAGCENAVRTILQATDGVVRADADHRRGDARVMFDAERVTEEQLRARLADSGFEPAAT